MSASDASRGLAGVSRGRSSLRGLVGEDGGGDEGVAEVAGIAGASVAGEVATREIPLTATPSDAASTPSATAAAVRSALGAVSRGFSRGALAGASGASASASGAPGGGAAGTSPRRADGGGSFVAVEVGTGLDEAGLSMFCAGEAIWIARGRSGTARSIPPEGVERRGVFGEGEAGDKGAGEFSHTLEALGVRP